MDKTKISQKNETIQKTLMNIIIYLPSPFLVGLTQNYKSESLFYKEGHLKNTLASFVFVF